MMCAVLSMYHSQSQIHRLLSALLWPAIQLEHYRATHSLPRYLLPVLVCKGKGHIFINNQYRSKRIRFNIICDICPHICLHDHNQDLQQFHVENRHSLWTDRCTDPKYDPFHKLSLSIQLKTELFNVSLINIQNGTCLTYIFCPLFLGI